MNEQTSSSRLGPKWLALAAGLVVVGGLGFWLFNQNQPKMVTTLYQYYPQNTALFVEMKPSSALAGKVMHGLDGLVAVVSQRKGLNTPSNMAQLFEKDFEPTFAAGVWSPVPAKEAAAKPQFLGVVTLKASVQPQVVLQDLKLAESQFEVSEYAGAKVYASRSPQSPSLAFHKQQLLFGETQEVLKAALDEVKTPESVITQPFIKQHLGELSAKRQGTVLMVSDEMQRLTPKSNASGLQAPLEAFQEKVRPAFPGSLSAIQIENDQLIHIQSIGPVEPDKITDTALRGDLMALMAKKGQFTMPQTLPQSTTVFAGMVDLAGYYDFFLKYIAPAETQKSIEQAGGQLKMMGLDLRKNIVALLEGPAALGITSASTSPQVALFFNQSAETIKTLDQLSTMAAQMTGGRVVEKQLAGNTKVNVIESRLIPISVGYSAIPQKPLVLATTAALESMASVSTGKEPSVGQSPLYQTLVGRLPQQVNSLVFVNTQAASQWLEALVRSQRPSQAQGGAVLKQLLASVKGVAMTSVFEGQKVHTDVVIELAP